jgi:hypothetical protein
VVSAVASATSRFRSAAPSVAIRSAAAFSVARLRSFWPPLGDQLLFPPGQLDLVLELVLGDRPLALDGQRTAFVRRPIGFLLHALTGLGLQRPLDVGVGPDGDHADIGHRQAALGEPGVVGQRRRDAVSHRRDAVGQRLGHPHAGQLVERRLLGQLGEQAAERLQRPGVPAAGLRCDPEVDPRGRQRRIGHAVVHRRLHRDVLEVVGAGVEQQRLLPIVEGNLDQGGGAGAEPERQSGPGVLDLPVAQVLHVRRRVGPQVVDEGVSRDVRHDRTPFSSLRR